MNRGFFMKRTKIALRNKVIYQVFVRNHTLEGTFKALISDLDRIKSLGVDIVYLLPIHPIGEKNRKGSLGSPYSIQDYMKINSELGTLDDFRELIKEVHSRNMKIMMDEVFNHTSRDSRLLFEHPEYFYRNKKGEVANKVGDWWDVIDLDYRKDKALWVELAETLKFYTKLGVDGFRMDVASLVPLDFWEFARKEVSKVNRNTIWLSESVHGDFLKHIRDEGFEGYSESEIYQVFDMAYDYDVYPYMEAYLKGERPFKDYLEALKKQDENYPANYVKMKNLENHDLKRIADFVNMDMDKILNWTGFMFFQKGAAMLYAGQEFSSHVRPDLFEKDVFVRNIDISDYIRKLTNLKSKKVFSSGKYNVNIPKIDGVAYQTFEDEKEKYIGIFNVGQVSGEIEVNLNDGLYSNLLNRKKVKVHNGKIKLGISPIVIRTKKEI